MTALLTPMSAFLASCLNPEPLTPGADSSETSNQSSVVERDPFSQAFLKHHTEAHGKKLSDVPNTMIFEEEQSVSDRWGDVEMGNTGYGAIEKDDGFQGVMALPSLTDFATNMFPKAPEEDRGRFYRQLSPNSAARIERNRLEWRSPFEGFFEGLDNSADNNRLVSREDVEMAQSSSSFSPPQRTSVSSSERPKRKKREPLDEKEQDIKHKKFLERNRIAAGKCRTRKKMRVESLEERFNATKNINAVMKESVQMLEDEIQHLKDTLSTEHVCKSAPGHVEKEDAKENSKDFEKLKLLVVEDEQPEAELATGDKQEDQEVQKEGS